MRVPDTGQPLYERRIVREGNRIAERMLNGYSVTANGRFVKDSDMRGGLLSSARFYAAIQALTGLYARAAKALRY
jgi:hypothetical protein